AKASSVRSRLRNLAREQKRPFDLLVQRYAIERLLYRLSRSGHADAFILKGATLFLNWTDQLHRPTKDVDFLAFGEPDVERLEEIFRDVLQTEVEPDGLTFWPDTIRGEDIREQGVYRGVRLKFDTSLGSAQIADDKAFEKRWLPGGPWI
ncbi:MAG: nucleotidyl transferase AbiEii/AbiGii toxin family protein, partial [Bradymonadaceae bacterium]